MKLEFVTLEDHPRRGIAFLISSNEKVTAKSVFDGLENSNPERMLLTRFEGGIHGLPNKRWYHGWAQSQYNGNYTNCFVFKCQEKRLEHRFYGFLCNPKPSDRRYQVCVLIRHAFKKEWETDETDFKIIEEIGTTPAVQKAIDDYFKEKP